VFSDATVGSATHFERQMNETTVGVHLLDLEAGPVEARTRMFGQDRDEFRARRGFFASENTIEVFFQKLIEIDKKIMF
jgi:hypothetical protein